MPREKLPSCLYSGVLAFYTLNVSRKTRLIASISFILIISFLSISLLNYYSSEEAMELEIISSSLPLLRENIYSEIQRDLSPSINRASVMANDSFLKNWALEGEQDSTMIVEYLKEIRDKYGYFSTFFVSDLSKKYYYHDGVLKTVSRSDSHDVWYYRFVESGKEYDLDVDTNEAAANEMTIFVNYRVEDTQGNLIGVTGVGIRMEAFSSFLNQQQEKYNRKIFLTDESGLIQAHSEGEMIESVSLTDRPGMRGIADSLLIKDSKPVYSNYRSEAGRILVTSRFMPELEWFLIVEHNETESLAAARRNLYRTILTGVIASFLIILLIGFTINYYQSQLEKLVASDELTGIANRREFNERLERGVYRFHRYNIPLSLIIVDIDNFKMINDSKGHPYGDKILKYLASEIEENLRPDDIFARLGGDEFAVLLELDLEGAEKAAERLKKMCSSEEVKLSLGVSAYRGEESSEEFVQRADKALYRSKQQGKDRISVIP